MGTKTRHILDSEAVRELCDPNLTQIMDFICYKFGLYLDLSQYGFQDHRGLNDKEPSSPLDIWEDVRSDLERTKAIKELRSCISMGKVNQVNYKSKSGKIKAILKADYEGNVLDLIVVKNTEEQRPISHVRLSRDKEDIQSYHAKVRYSRDVLPHTGKLGNFIGEDGILYEAEADLDRTGYLSTMKWYTSSVRPISDEETHDWRKFPISGVYNFDTDIPDFAKQECVNLNIDRKHTLYLAFDPEKVHLFAKQTEYTGEQK